MPHLPIVDVTSGEIQRSWRSATATRFRNSLIAPSVENRRVPRRARGMALMYMYVYDKKLSISFHT